MRLAVLATLAAATLAVAIHVLIGTHEAEPTPAAPPPRAVAAAAPAPESGPPMPVRRPVVAPAPPAEDEPAPPPHEERPFVKPTDNADQETAEVRLRRVPRELLDRVAPCGEGLPDGDGSIDVQYQLVASGGQVQIEQVQVLDSSLANQRLESCIQGRIADTSWDEPGFPDMNQSGRITVTRHDLARRQPEE